jgi:hypothetical protein
VGERTATLITAADFIVQKLMTTSPFILFFGFFLPAQEA